MKTAWIRIRRRVTRRISRIQAFDTMTAFPQTLSVGTLKIKTDKKFNRQHFYRARG